MIRIIFHYLFSLSTSYDDNKKITKKRRGQDNRNKTPPTTMNNHNQSEPTPQHRTGPILHPAPLPPNQGVPLPPGWMSVIDPISGKVYYANPTTGQTSWEPPSLLLPPPPQPSPSNEISNNITFQGVNNSNVDNNTSLQQTIATSTFQNNNDNNIIYNTSTYQNTGFFIPTVRSIVEQSASSSTSSNNNDLEFKELSSGCIADLAHIQLEYREQQRLSGQNVLDEQDEANDDDERKKYYEPLKPMELPITSRAPHIESGRVDIRIMTLMDTLGKI